MDALHILVEQGKVLYLGISDSAAWICVCSQYLRPRSRQDAVQHLPGPFGTRCTATHGARHHPYGAALRYGCCAMGRPRWRDVPVPKGSRGTQKEQRKSPFHECALASPMTKCGMSNALCKVAAEQRNRISYHDRAGIRAMQTSQRVPYRRRPQGRASTGTTRRR
jgi:hypothetical protein